MLKNLDYVSGLIRTGKLLHISAAGELLGKLPRGNWIGGSTEYFLDKAGGKISGDLLDVRELDFATYKFASYDARSLPGVTRDAYPNGFSIIVLPFDSEVHKQYAQNAANYDDIFIKPIVGWISGVNLDKPGQSPLAVNGFSGEASSDKAVALHVALPEDKSVSLNIINIFSPDEKGPLIEFAADGFSAQSCLVDGKETVLADYIAKNKLDTKLPLVGDYFGAGINVSIKRIEGGAVYFYAPVFRDIGYRFAKPMENYAQAFKSHVGVIADTECVFACNCILNFLYGELEGKDLGAFYGPITFGEIAYQLLNQTLVYLRVVDKNF
ncbi:MAG: hypothetical protein LBO03_08365 [Acidaminococcales bacterium]|nr:hypothetical protein [Acidaminococcales bacterium]